jgi:hypothetical protein
VLGKHCNGVPGVVLLVVPEKTFQSLSGDAQLQVRLLRMGGLGGKAALLLAAVAGGTPGADAAAALRVLLQPPDLAALVRVALLASHAQDLVRGRVQAGDIGSTFRGLLTGGSGCGS